MEQVVRGKAKALNRTYLVKYNVDKPRHVKFCIVTREVSLN